MRTNADYFDTATNEVTTYLKNYKTLSDAYAGYENAFAAELVAVAIETGSFDHDSVTGEIARKYTRTGNTAVVTVALS